VSAVATLRGVPGVALGNVVGSNIANVALVLGLAAVILPVTVERGIFRRDMPVLFAATAAVLLVGADGTVNRPEGALLFAALIGFVVIAYRAQEIPGQQAPEEAAAIEQLEAELPPVPALSVPVEALLLAAGVVMLSGGAQLFVVGATDIASRAGVGEFAIGATLVATGTSLPEVATSAVAAARRMDDIAVANVIGSNIFNALGVLGFAALASPLGVDRAIYAFEMPVLVITALLLIPLITLRRPFHLGRLEGSVLLASFVAFSAITLARGA